MLNLAYQLKMQLTISWHMRSILRTGKTSLYLVPLCQCTLTFNSHRKKNVNSKQSLWNIKDISIPVPSFFLISLSILIHSLWNGYLGVKRFNCPQFFIVNKKIYPCIVIENLILMFLHRHRHILM